VTSLSAEVQAIADRFARVDRAHPTIDTQAVELALRQHLHACGLSNLPILRVADAEEGYDRGTVGRANRSWRRLFGEIERKLHNYGVEGAWEARVLAWPLAWHPVETVVTDLAERSVTRRLGRARRPSGTGASGAVRALGWIAAAAMNPTGHHSALRRPLPAHLSALHPGLRGWPLALLGARQQRLGRGPASDRDR